VSNSHLSRRGSLTSTVWASSSATALERAASRGVRRAHHDLALDASQPSRRQIALVERPHANGKIEPRVDDARGVVGEREVHPHLRHLGQETREDRHQHDLSEPDGCRYADQTGGLLRRDRELTRGALGLDEQRANPIVQRAACGGEAVRARRSAQERGAERFLELRQPPRERGLRDAERAARGAERAVVHDAHEDPHGIEVGVRPSFHGRYDAIRRSEPRPWIREPAVLAERALLSSPRMARIPSACAFATAAFLMARTAPAQPPESPPAKPDEGKLAREVENPVSKLSFIPIRYENDFGIGPTDLARNTLSIRPTIAVPVAPDLNVVSRTTVPFVWQPDIGHGLGSRSGLGDVAESLFFVPSPTSGVVWSMGPSVSLPTASAKELGSGQLGVGPTAALLLKAKPLMFGVLALQVWSIGRRADSTPDGPDINRLSAMCFAAYQLPGGWYVKTSPVITANWNAGSLRNMWTIPIGGGAGKVLYIGDIPMSVSVAAYWNAVRPDTAAAPTGSAQVQVAVLFPR
jgi:hypothetical protein